jgi:thiol-disulfide isomerase/thioredoxin
MKVVNQHSFLILALGTLAILAALAISRTARSRRINISLVIVLAFFLTGYLLLNPGTGSSLNSDQITATVGNGTPVLLEFQSPYCVACMAAKPIVDRIEQMYTHRLIVIRLNVQDPASKTIMARYAFQYTPTFILFNAQGREILRRVGAIDADEIGPLLTSTP